MSQFWKYNPAEYLKQPLYSRWLMSAQSHPPASSSTDVSRHFGGLKAVDGVNLTVLPGERHAVIGPNGAGKTTLFNLISGELPATAGRDHVVRRRRHHAGAASAGGARHRPDVSDHASCFPNLTVLENLLLACEALDRRKFTMLRPLSSCPDLVDERADALIERVRPVAVRQRASRATCPTATSASWRSRCRWPAGRGCCCWTSRWPASPRRERDSMQELLEKLDPAIAVLLIEHDMDVAFGFAERITVLYQGRVLARATTTRSAPTAASSRCYLGMAGPNEPMLYVIDLHTYYGDSHVLQGVTLTVERGTVTAVLGRNGVGKTTLCRSIVGFTPARVGRIVFNGIDITRLPPHRILRPAASAWCRRAAASSRR